MRRESSKKRVGKKLAKIGAFERKKFFCPSFFFSRALICNENRGNLKEKSFYIQLR